MGPAAPKTKNDCTGKDQQQFAREISYACRPSVHVHIKLSLQQSVEAHRVVRRRGSHII
jgi:hypothetical protein